MKKTDRGCPRIQAVIFDWAGTTCDFGSLAPVWALQTVFARHGVSLSAELARGPMGQAKRDHLNALLFLSQVQAQWAKHHGRTPEPPDVDLLYAEFVPVQLEALRQRAQPIPGIVEATAELRRRGLKVGSTTGYTAEMMAVLSPLLARYGYSPDAVCTVSEVRAGRPAPWMALRCAERLGVWPMTSIVKVGDTIADIEEGLAAGMWTIGFAACGNEMGLDEAEWAALAASERRLRLARARRRLKKAGAHVVVDGPSELLAALGRIENRLLHR